MTRAPTAAQPPGATAATPPTRAGGRLSTWRWSSIPDTRTPTTGETIMTTTSTADTIATTDPPDPRDLTAMPMPKHLKILLSLTMLWTKKVPRIMSLFDNRIRKQLSTFKRLNAWTVLLDLIIVYCINSTFLFHSNTSLGINSTWTLIWYRTRIWTSQNKIIKLEI